MEDETVRDEDMQKPLLGRRPDHGDTKPLPLRTGIEIVLVLGISIPFLVMSHRIGGTEVIGGILGWVGIIVGIIAVFIALKLRGQSAAVIGIIRAPGWPRTLLLGIAATVGVLLIAQLAQNLVFIPLLDLPPPDISRFEMLEGNLGALLIGLFAVWTAAAFGEEIIYRGYLLGRLAELFGGERRAWAISLVLGSTLFGLLHFYQGIGGIVITGFVGFLFGLVYLLVKRNLWVTIIAHGLIDTISFIALYFGMVGQ